MAARNDVENGQRRVDEEIREPLILPVKGEDGYSGQEEVKKGRNEERWMVYLSTFIAVCGSYEFGCCVSVFIMVISA